MKIKKDKTQKQVAYEKTKNYILTSGIAPGTPLDEQSLTKITGTSRTPVREALHRLEIDGLVTIIPNKGAFITHISMQDIKELFQLREVVEGLAARLAVNNISIAKLDEINNLFIQAENEKDPARKLEMHMKSNDMLHDYIFKAAGNSRLIKLDQSYHNFIKLEINLTNSIRGIVEKSNKEHTAIVEALRSGDPDKAEKAMRQHIASVFNNIMAVI